MKAGEPRSPLPDTLWLVLRAHWAAGLLLLLVLTGISRPALALAWAAFFAGAVLDRMGLPRLRWPRASGPLVAAAALAATADLLFGTGDLLSAMSLLVLGVQAILFLLPKNHRVGWELCAIAFLEFLAAAESTTEIRFGLFLLLFLGLSAGAMWALQAEESAERAGVPAPRVKPRFAALMALVAMAGGVSLTAVFFAVTPRIGMGHFLRHTGSRTGLTGFSDEISLRDVTGVKADRRVVARIEYPAPGPGVPPETLYLRGATYARFDGARWSRGRPAFRRIPRAGRTYILSPPGGASVASAEIFLEPTDGSALFVYPQTVSIAGALGEIRTDGRGNYRLPADLSAVRYRLRFLRAGALPKTRLRAPDAVYLALPPGSDAVRNLARRVTAGAETDEEKVDRALQFFRSGFRYSLTDAASSVNEFLFRKRSGFCEHFAAGLTVLLRAAGIPARVAAGYWGGEWNDVGRYLIVRQSDAHAWTEAWLGGTWVTLDATPPQGENSPFFARTGRIGLYLDWARERWNRYVVNYSLRMQAQAVARGWLAVRGAGLRLRAGARRVGGGRAAAALILSAAALLALWRARKTTAGEAPPEAWGARSSLSRPYARLLRRLSSAGFRPSPGTPVEAMLRRAAAVHPTLAADAGRFLSLYHRDRFGPRALSAEEAVEARALAVRLRRAVSRTRGR